MKKGCCILAVLAVILTAYPAFMVFSFRHYYGEAEPLANQLAVISSHLAALRSQSEEMPATVQELLQLLPEKDRARFDDRPILWQPDADPMLKMRANKKYGFVIDQACRLRWITTEEELESIFPAAP